MMNGNEMSLHLANSRATSYLFAPRGMARATDAPCHPPDGAQKSRIPLLGITSLYGRNDARARRSWA
jgi:hypothetical protein